MRKAFALILTVPFLLASCAVTTPESSEADADWQLQVILDNVSTWEVSEDHPFGETSEADAAGWGFAFAVTDLDNDGYLELLKQAHYKSSVILWVYEVTLDGELTLCDSTLDTDDCKSMDYPYIDDSLQMYQNENGESMYFCCHTEADLQYRHEQYGWLTLRGRELSFEILFEDTMTVEDYTFYDSGGNEISEEEFNQLLEECESLATGEVNIGWFYEPTMENLISSFESYE